METFSLTRSHCDRPALSFKPGTAPVVWRDIVIKRGERGEILCREHLFMRGGEAQRRLNF